MSAVRVRHRPPIYFQSCFFQSSFSKCSFLTSRHIAECTQAVSKKDPDAWSVQHGPWRVGIENGMRLRCAGSDGFLEFLGSAESNLLARFDLDRFTGGGIAAHARGALAYLKNAEAANTNAVALLEVLDHHRNEVVENRLGLFLGHLVIGRERGGEMLERDGRLGCFGH